MFRRAESARERTLLRLIDEQQRTIRDLTDRLMYATGNVWVPPPDSVSAPSAPPAERDWTAAPEQEPIY
jgi:hypothetical protein